MTSADWIKLIIAALVGALTKQIFDKVFASFIPTGKQIVSFLRKTWTIIGGFLAPIGLIVYEYSQEEPFTKWFLLKIVVLVGVVLVNLNLELTLILIKRVKHLEDASKSVADK